MGARTLVRVDVAERRDGAVVITVTGELDVHTRLLLARPLARHEARRVLLDNAAVEFTDTAGLATVIGAASARTGGSVEVVALSDAVRRLRKLTGAGDALLQRSPV